MQNRTRIKQNHSESPNNLKFKLRQILLNVFMAVLECHVRLETQFKYVNLHENGKIFVSHSKFKSNFMGTKAGA